MIGAHGNGRSYQLPSKRWRPRAPSRAAQTNVAAIDCSYGWARSVGSVLPIPTWILFFGGVLVFCRLCWCGLSLLSDCCGAGRQGRQEHRDNDDKEPHRVHSFADPQYMSFGAEGRVTRPSKAMVIDRRLPCYRAAPSHSHSSPP
jgi:hypothetical protein